MAVRSRTSATLPQSSELETAEETTVLPDSESVSISETKMAVIEESAENIFNENVVDNSVFKLFTLDQWCSDELYKNPSKEFLIFAFKIHTKNSGIFYKTPEDWQIEFSTWLNSAF